VIEITLGIPLFRSAAFLPALFDKLEGLKSPPAELIFVDDASPDDSADMAEEFIEAWPGTARIVRLGVNLGIAAAYNRIAQESASTWVQILDADDYPASADYYDKVLPNLDPDTAVLVTAVESNARLLDRGARFFAPLISRTPPPWLPLLGSVATRSGVLYRRSVLVDSPFPDPAYPGSDVIHLAMMRQHHRCRYEAAASIHYRIHPGASSAQPRSYAQYRQALARLPLATRMTHLVDLGARRIGQVMSR
jgi:glycosyltransferase involved in cell wall biosynthesis